MSVSPHHNTSAGHNLPAGDTHPSLPGNGAQHGAGPRLLVVTGTDDWGRPMVESHLWPAQRQGHDSFLDGLDPAA